MNNIPYGRHHITNEDIQAVTNVLKSDFLTQGPTVSNFESAFSETINAKETVAVSNGTAALHLAALALGVQTGDKVLCTPNSFAASANCIRYCGGELEFVDIDPQNYCIDLDLLEKKLKQNPNSYKGIVAVDFAGFPIDLERLRKIADEHSMWIIEDACHAIGSRFKKSDGTWEYAGNGEFADIATYSFHPVKHIAMGEGGAAVTKNPVLAAKIRQLRTHGITKDPDKISHPELGWYYEMQELGFNYRLPDMNAALGLSQLSRIKNNLSRRREIAKIYDQAFVSRGMASSPDDSKEHAYHLYILQVENRLQLYNHLKEKGIFAQIHYIQIPDLPYYKERYGDLDLPNSKNYYEKTLSLPMFPELTKEQTEFVIDSVLEIYP